MLVYLLEDELMLAKFLWKRIPPTVKQADPTLERLWSAGSAIIRRDAEQAYAAMDGLTWPEHLAPLVAKLRGAYCLCRL